MSSLSWWDCADPDTQVIGFNVRNCLPLLSLSFGLICKEISAYRALRMRLSEGRSQKKVESIIFN